MNKLKVNMYAGGLNIEGQGVGANFFEQVDLVKRIESLDVSVNGRNPKKPELFRWREVPKFCWCRQKKLKAAKSEGHNAPGYTG